MMPDNNPKGSNGADQSTTMQEAPSQPTTPQSDAGQPNPNTVSTPATGDDEPDATDSGQ